MDQFRLALDGSPFAAEQARSSRRRCVQQASDCQSRDELGQFIREWLVGADAERLLREQLAVPDENGALACQPDGPRIRRPVSGCPEAGIGARYPPQ
jgi:hypothetical protein